MEKTWLRVKILLLYNFYTKSKSFTSLKFSSFINENTFFESLYEIHHDIFPDLVAEVQF